MRFPFITRAAHERILRACEDAALERLESELAQADRAHQDALDRYRGRMRPADREVKDQAEAARAIMHVGEPDQFFRGFQGSGPWTR
jgi:hypothetical protein